jgi:hydrogenase maturation protease
VCVIQPRYASDFPKALSAHDIGLKDLVDSAAILEMLPKVILVTISVADLQPMQMTMSPEVEASLLEVEATVISLLASVAGS